MELKPDNRNFQGIIRFLLIVPYGIETVLPVVQPIGRNSLLIVPYGIETLQQQFECFTILSF